MLRTKYVYLYCNITDCYPRVSICLKNTDVAILYFVGAGDEAAASKRVWLAKKKIYFFTVFSNEFADDLSPLSKVVDIEYSMDHHMLAL